MDNFRNQSFISQHLEFFSFPKFEKNAHFEKWKILENNELHLVIWCSSNVIKFLPSNLKHLSILTLKIWATNLFRNRKLEPKSLGRFTYWSVTVSYETEAAQFMDMDLCMLHAFCNCCHFRSKIQQSKKKKKSFSAWRESEKQKVFTCGGGNFQASNIKQQHNHSKKKPQGVATDHERVIFTEIDGDLATLVPFFFGLRVFCFLVFFSFWFPVPPTPPQTHTQKRKPNLKTRTKLFFWGFLIFRKTPWHIIMVPVMKKKTIHTVFTYNFLMQRVCTLICFRHFKLYILLR